VSGQFAAVQQLILQPPAGAIHFSGHGYLPDQAAGAPDYAIELEDRRLDVTTWRGLAGGAVRPPYPFYFFNACDVGESRAIANFVEGWGPAALDSGAAGYVGGLWPLLDQAAADFAVRFYGYVDRQLQADGRVSVAAALANTRRGFYETGDPTFLAYAFYGDANLRFVRQ
jgi:CHAT domain-containing protein